MSVPSTVILPGVGRIMTETEQQVFSALVLQFLVNNMLSDIELNYTFVVVHMQVVIPGPPPALNVTCVVSADVYSPSHEIPADFDYRENVEYGFETNMTGFLDTLPPLEDNRNVSSFSIADVSDKTIGIVIVCVAVLALQVVLVSSCIFRARNRRKEETTIILTEQRQQQPEAAAGSVAVVGWRTIGSSMESEDELLPSASSETSTSALHSWLSWWLN